MEAEVTIIWHQIPVAAIPWDNITFCVNGADASPIANNQYTFMSSSYMGPILQSGTTPRIQPNFICLTPKVSTAYQMSNGQWAEDLTYKFLYKPFGANKYYRWTSGRYEPAGSLTPFQIEAHRVGGIPLAQIVLLARPWHPEKDMSLLFWD
jgi:hypothetical protein